MIDADALAKAIIDAIADEAGIVTVNQAAGAEREAAQVIVAHLTTDAAVATGHGKEEYQRLCQISAHVRNLLDLADPARVAEWISGAVAELRIARQLERVVLNQLGTTDPKQVAEWIVEARASLRALQSRSTEVDPRLVGLCAAAPGDRSYIARCAPQADGATVSFPVSEFRTDVMLEATRPPHPLAVNCVGATEQDVIALQREYTNRVSDVASRGNPSAPGSDSLTSETPARTCCETLDYLDGIIATAESRDGC